MQDASPEQAADVAQQAAPSASLGKVLEFFETVMSWAKSELLQTERLIEVLVIITAIFVANITCKWAHLGLLRIAGDHAFFQKADKRFLHPLLTGLMALILIWTARFLLEPVMGPTYFLDFATSLFGAWLVIRLAAGLVANKELARIVAIMAWTVAALNIIGLLDPILQVMEAAQLPLGEAHVSLLDVITGILSFALFLWLAGFLSKQIESQVTKVSSVPPSARVLIVKSSKIILIGLAFMMALNSTGIDMTAFAVFGGALGVGLGFGLQKVVGNFISGIILLLDRSIKPGDVIEVGKTYGRINKLAARYTSVITRDGTEFLIPNEDMITQPVVNWSHSNRLVRQRIPVQVDYKSDIRKAMILMEQAAGKEQRILKIPAPKTLLQGFDADGVNLELRMWIDDPQEGVSNVGSKVRLNIWDLFGENDIKFPYPQRVIHIAREPDSETLAFDLSEMANTDSQT